VIRSSQSSSVISTSGTVMHPNPALFTKKSVLLNFFIVSLAKFSIWFLSRTSTGIDKASLHELRSASAVASPVTLFRSALTKLAPALAKVRAIALPIPDPLPVTMQLYPAEKIDLGPFLNLLPEWDFGGTGVRFQSVLAQPLSKMAAIPRPPPPQMHSKP
jgi:hypothetical protein